MAYFALIYETVEDFVAQRVPFRFEHLQMVREAHERGELVMAGALGDPADRDVGFFSSGRLRMVARGMAQLRPTAHQPMNENNATNFMIESARMTGAGLIEWASKVQPGDTVQIDWNGTLRDVPKTIILTQVINHATEHREQVKATMTQLGIEPPDLQSWSYFNAL